MKNLFLIALFFTGFSFAQETKTSIGFALSPNFSSVRYVEIGNSSQGEIESIESSTNGSPGLSGNVFFQYELTEKLFVTWGLGLQNYRFSTNFPWQNSIGSSSKVTYSQYYLQLSTSVKYRIYRTLYARAGIGVDVLAEPRFKTANSSMDDLSTNYKESMVPVSLGLGYELKLTDRLNFMAELFGTMVVTDALEITPNSSVLQRKPLQLGLSIGIIRSF